MLPYQPRVFRTEIMVPLLTLTVVEQGNSHLLHAECAGTRHQVIIMVSHRVKAARYLVTFY